MGARHVLRWWGSGLVHPAAVLRGLPDSGRPRTGLVAVGIRFVVQDLVETLPLALLGRRPFMPSRLPIRPERHYRAQLAFLPAVGVASWLLMGTAAQGVLRMTGERADLSRVLDVIGTGMLLPMPALWACDVALIAANRFRLPELAFVNPPAALWGTAIYAVGLHAKLGVPWRRAVPAAAAATVVYVVCVSSVVR